jgi:hypothetical protein
MMALTGLGKGSIALAVAVGALACAGRARAQEPRMVPVEISATQPGSHIWVRGRGREFRCGEGCVLQLPEHDYRVIIRDPEGHLSATALNISSPTGLTVSPGNHRNKMLGIGLFAGGLAGVTAGGVLLYLSVLVHSDFISGRCSPDCSDVPRGSGTRAASAWSPASRSAQPG